MRNSAVLLLSTALVLLLASNRTPSLSGSSAVSAQVSVPGRFPVSFAGSLDPFPSESSDDEYLDHAISRKPPPLIQLPLIDNGQLLRDEDESRNAMFRQTGAEDGSYRFGKAIAIEAFDYGVSTLDSGRWVPLRQLHPNNDWSYDDMDQDEEVMVWQLEIYSKSALSLNLIFSDFRLPPGTEFYVSGKRHILGAFTAAVNNKPDGIFATAPVAGDRLLLAYYTTRGMLRQGVKPKIQLSHVIHGYKPTVLAASSHITAKGPRLQDDSTHSRYSSRHMRDGLRDQQVSESWFTLSETESEGSTPLASIMSGKCNIDVACHLEEYRDQSRSVGVLLTDYNQKYCTGALINNVLEDGRQLFLTAAHCSNYADTSAHVVMFNHEQLLCGAGPGEVNEHDTAQGLVKLATFPQSDFTLYEIVEPIPVEYNVYLSGWSALPKPPSSRPREHDKLQEEDRLQDRPGYLSSAWRGHRRYKSYHDQIDDPVPVPSPPASSPEDPAEAQIPIVGIHHPSGDAKKISFFYNGSLPRSCWNDCEKEGGEFHWKIPRWDRGTTEPGSSGSPLFDADKRIVGQLHGGSASCWNTNGFDMYGALHASFQQAPKIKDRLATYLDPGSTGTKTMDGCNLGEARRGASKSMKKSSVEEEENWYDEPSRIETLGRHSLEKPGIGSGEGAPCQYQQDGGMERVSRHAHRHQSLLGMFDRFGNNLGTLWWRLFQGYDERSVLAEE